jgi:ATP-dependent exoDNAse (exonuclease V) beta subunit
VAGQLVHSYLERWLLESDFELEKLAWLGKQQIVPPNAALLRAESILAAFYTGRIPDRPLFAYQRRVRRGTVLGREVPFYLSHTGRLWNGVIDLILEENRTIIGVDYKTSPEKDELSASYRQQATIYTEALRQIFPDRTVAFEFWWLDAPGNQGGRRKKR